MSAPTTSTRFVIEVLTNCPMSAWNDWSNDSCEDVKSVIGETDRFVCGKFNAF